MKCNLYFKHDLYALTDNKLRKLVSKFSTDGYAVFFETIAVLTRSDSHKYDFGELVTDLAYDLHITEDRVSQALTFAVEECDLFFMDGNFVQSNRVNESFREKEEFSKKQSEKGKKGMEARWRKDNSSYQNDNSGYENHNSGYEKDNTCYENDNQPITNKKEKKRKEQEQENKDTSYLSKPADFDGREKANSDDFSLSSDDSIQVQPVRDTTPYREIVDYWNSHAEGKLPLVVKLTEQRKKAIRSRWAEYKEDVYKAIDKAVSSKWLTQTWNGCSFDWVMCPSNIVKVLEGNYDKDRFNNPSGGGKEPFRPRDNTGRYDHIKSEVIEI